ncbi:MAG TPA: four helix bundle protein [Chitinivibrionales bacterium]|nr:four helix bundle protein [Chitinivibrionales bacterium]
MTGHSVKDLNVYKKAYELATGIYELSKSFPPDEQYASISQIRRCSRSVCLNLREAWAKRRYVDHFINKLTDCDGENSETDSCLDFALHRGYVSGKQHRHCVELCAEIGKMLGAVITRPEGFILTADR